MGSECLKICDLLKTEYQLGCDSCLEALDAAVDLATEEAWNMAGSRLIERLSVDAGIRIPWIHYRHSGQVPAVDARAQQALVAKVKAIVGYLRENFCVATEEDYNYELAKTIFLELLPHEDYDDFRKDPEGGIWKYYFCAKHAGLDVKMVFVEYDHEGMRHKKASVAKILGSFDHVALSVEVDPKSGKRVTVDPMLGVYDLDHERIRIISKREALSHHYVHRSGIHERTCDGIRANIAKALELDPKNAYAMTQEIFMGSCEANKFTRDPFKMQRETRMFQIRMARENLKGSRAGDRR